MRFLVAAVLGFILITSSAMAQNEGRSFGSGTCREKMECSDMTSLPSDQLADQAKNCAWEALGLNVPFDSNTSALDSNNCVASSNPTNTPAKGGLDVQCCVTPVSESTCVFRCSLMSH